MMSDGYIVIYPVHDARGISPRDLASGRHIRGSGIPMQWPVKRGGTETRITLTDMRKIGRGGHPGP